MLSLALCGICFCFAFLASRSSLKLGLGIVMFIGYFYGIVRANVPQALSHFIFDAAAAGLYLALWRRGFSPVQRIRTRKLRLWLALLAGWPIFLLFVPLQEPLIQLVGLRAAIWFLPFVLIGAILEKSDLRALALWLGTLNLVALAFAGAEYFLGLPRFFPYNAVTQIIYGSHDVAGYTAYRIPATFANSASYAAVMTVTLPLLLGAWARKGRRAWESWLLLGSLAAALLGVFLSGSRSQAVILFMQCGFLLTLGGFRSRRVLGFLVIVLGVAWIIAQNPRLQRFTTLDDASFVQERIGTSVNTTFFEAATDFPLGNGLGGGGTSIPYFLQADVRAPLVLENEYGHIMIEQGIPGLCLWVTFLIWSLARVPRHRGDTWQVGRRLAWFTCLAHFGAAFIGVGLMTSIPCTSILLLLMGWTAAPQVALIRRVQVDSAAESSFRRYSEGKLCVVGK